MKRLSMVLILAGCSISAQAVFAADWQAASGNWTNAADWGGSLPTDNEQCYINNNGTCQMNSVVITNNNLWRIGNSGGTLNKLQVLSGTLHTNDGVRLGVSGGATVGHFEQSGGHIHAIGWDFIYKDCTWTTSGGYYRNPGNDQTRIEGGGTITQTGGTNHFHILHVGSGGSADGTAIYEISGGHFDNSYNMYIASDPTVHSVFHVIGSEATIQATGNQNIRLRMENTNAELRVTLDASGCSAIDVGDRDAIISNSVLSVNSDLFQGELLASTVTVIRARTIFGTLSRTNLMGNVKSAEVFVEGNDLKIRDIVLRPKSTVIMIR